MLQIIILLEFYNKRDKNISKKYRGINKKITLFNLFLKKIVICSFLIFIHAYINIVFITLLAIKNIL